MTPFREILSNYRSENFGSVSLANEKICDVHGLGDACLIFDNGFKLILKNVRYVPDLAHNLISCSALEEEGLEGKWGKGIMKIMKGSLTMFKAERKRNLYICTVKYDCFAAPVLHTNKIDLWHKRLGHISSKGLELLHKQGILKEKYENMNFCDDCILGKHHKVHFPSSPSPNSTSTCILDYVHADVWGPANIPTHGGNRYFLSIIDNFSRKVFVFLIKQKSEVFEKFKNWKTLVENQTGKKLKALRTDNGLEFCNQQFSTLCETCGIKRHRTTPYTPQQNGVAERMNRTLLNKVRCLLISSGLAKSFWGEALLTAAYLINRSPSVPLLGKLPECVWTGKNVDLSYLRIFGCSAFVFQNSDKLEPRALKCVFIGYPEGIKGYRLWLRCQPGFKVEENLADNQQGEELRQENQHNSVNNETETLSNSENSYQLARDRERRESRIPSRYKDFHLALNTVSNEPSSYEEALKTVDSEKWIKAMNEEIKALHDNNTWTLVPKPKDASVVDCKWIFKIKQENNTSRFKARLVAKGFTQKEGIDYTEIFAPVVKYTTVRIILALAAHFDWELKQMDVKTAFLHGMTIDRDRKNSVIFLNQKTYVKTVLEKFSMENAKTTPVPLAAHFQLSKEQSPKTESETEHMKSVPYSNAIGSVMYLMVSTRPDIAYAVSCLSRYMSNAGLPHWEALKWLLRYLKGSINTEAEILLPLSLFILKAIHYLNK
ncbi:Retrovirus-related Pol polyprotein from transposon TNT 1-94 [Sesamum angolense]|uniref:Retrovirus-related Pol polyprotein from transposon TNT 1-94 n=1 Tax=Sesamum angolense TaxID=2727404 RepID=A0AAE1TAR6_9LAMI|nr:Retrovirus-related Pol polyprotein from transposon TNT 1-94 [Sesamum angolense]